MKSYRMFELVLTRRKCVYKHRPRTGKEKWGKVCIKTGVVNLEGFPSGSVVKNPHANVGDVGFIQYSCLENPMNRAAA